MLTIPQVLQHPQIEALGLVTSVMHPKLGAIPQLQPPIMMSDTPGKVALPPPAYGEHTAVVLQEVGYSADEIEEFAAQKIVHVPELARR